MAGAASKAPYDAFLLRMFNKETNSKTHTQCIWDCFGRVPSSSVWYVCIGGDGFTAAVWMAVRACFDIIRLQVMHNHTQCISSRTANGEAQAATVSLRPAPAQIHLQQPWRPPPLQLAAALLLAAYGKGRFSTAG